MVDDELVKIIGKGTDAVRELGRFIAPLIKGSLEQGMGIVEDKLTYVRAERAARLRVNYDIKMKEIGLQKPTREIPLKFAIPLIQSASLEDDDELQDRWAALLVNAANENSDVEPKRVYISILEQISPLEALILEKIYSLPYEQIQHNGVLTQKLPDVALIAEKGKSDDSYPSPEVELALANLARLGCISGRRTWGGSEVFPSVTPTLLGQKFVEACTLQKDNP